MAAAAAAAAAAHCCRRRRQRGGRRQRRCARLLVLLLAVLLLASASAQEEHDQEQATHKAVRRWTPSTFPNPQRDVHSCGRSGRVSSLCDPDGVLDAQAQDMVEGLINEIAQGKEPFRRAPCGDAGPQGYQIAVALMRHMDHSKHADKAAATRAFAKALHDSWGVGDPSCQNGVLLLLAVGDRQAYISSGSGVRAAVSDQQLAGVLDAVRPALKHRRYADAVLAAVNDVGLLLAGRAPDPAGVDADDGWGIFAFFCAAVAAVMGWGAVSSRRQRRRFKRCADRLEAIKRDQRAIMARERTYAARSCPICLEDFAAPAAPAAVQAAAAAEAGEAGGSSGSGGSGGDGAPAAAAEAASAAAAAAAAAAAGASAASTAAAADDGGDNDDAAAAATGPSAPLLPRELGGGGGGKTLKRGFMAIGSLSGGSSSSRAAGGGGGGGGNRLPLVLRCGHAFCDPCISQWLGAHTTCPVCRKSLTDDEAAEAEPAAAADAAAAAERRRQQAPSATPPATPPQSGSAPGSSSSSGGGGGGGAAAAARRPPLPQPASCGSPLPGGAGGPQAQAGLAAAAAAADLNPEELVRQRVWLPELNFRLRRLRALYPEFVTDPMLYAWEEDLSSGRPLDAGQVQQFEANDPARQAQLEAGGRAGAAPSAHFGGGSSHGGGGAGGSW